MQGETLLQDSAPRSSGWSWKVLTALSLLVGFCIGVLLTSGGAAQAPSAINMVGQYTPVKSSIPQLVPPMMTQQFAQPVVSPTLHMPQSPLSKIPQVQRLVKPASMRASGRGQSVVTRANSPIVTRADIQPKVDLTGKVAFLAGADSEQGYGWAIAKELADAGCTILFGVWPMALKIFEMNWKKKATQEARMLPNGKMMEVAKVYPLDAVYDDPSKVPDEIKENKRYKDLPFTIQQVVEQVEKDYGKIDFLVHSLANGPEVKKPLLDTSREGYLAASSASAYSLVSMVAKFGPIMNPGGAVVSLTYIASTAVIPGYGGGMSSAKAQLESDTRVLAYEAGRKFGIRVNTISAGPLASRAATAIGGDGDKPFIVRAREYSEMNAPIRTPLVSTHVGTAAFFLLTDQGAGVTGVTLPVDMGLNIMGSSLDSPAYDGLGLTDAAPQFN